MGKRSNFERKARDFYATPKEAVIPLLPFLDPSYSTFVEPCAGNNILVQHIEELTNLKCSWKSDLEPQAEGIEKANALDLAWVLEFTDCIITNPPWDRKLLHQMIEHFIQYAPTWLLFDADWMHTTQEPLAIREGLLPVPELMKYCAKIVSVGRVKWFGNISGKDNCAWYLFTPEKAKTMFHPRPNKKWEKSTTIPLTFE